MKNNIPAIRFPEFTLGWKSTTLNKVTNIIGGGTPDTKEPTYWDGEIDWYSPSEIGKKIYADGSVRKITQLGLEKSSAKILPANKTILFTSRAGIGDTAILKKDGATNQGFQSLVVHDNCDVYFLYSMNNKIKSYALKNASGSTFLEISGKNLGVMPMLIPSPEEQTKIGSFFKNLDDTIALHQQELEALKLTKKGFLQKMFPKNGKNVPEFRFKEFNDDWQKIRLGEVKDVRDGTHDSPKYYETGFPLVTSKNLKMYGLDLDDVSFISPEDYESINKRSKVDVGDILFGMIGTIGNPVILHRDDFAIKNVALIKRGGSIQNQFLVQLLKSHVFKHFIENENVGNTQKFIGLSKIRNFETSIPSQEEQFKIGEFFRQLDEVIELKKKEIEALKETKKGFLQKMFV